MNKLSFMSGFIYNKNNDHNYSFGRYTELKVFSEIALEECHLLHDKLKEKLLKEDEYLKSFNVDLSDYNDYNENGTAVYSSEENPFARNGLKKEAHYSIKHNRLRIYVNDLPVFENDNGVTCDDEAALCDCLC